MIDNIRMRVVPDLYVWNLTFTRRQMWCKDTPVWFLMELMADLFYEMFNLAPKKEHLRAR